METDRSIERAAAGRGELGGAAMVLAAAACWGTVGIFIKTIVAATGITALALAFWRDVTTFAVLMGGIAVLRPGWLKLRREDVRWLAAMGGTIGVFHVVWNTAVVMNGAAVATVQQAAMPAIVAVAAWALWREPLTWSKLAAIALTFAGTFLISAPEMLSGGRLSAGGLLIGLATPALYALWTLIAKKIRERYNPLVVLAYAFGFAALVLLPFQFLTPQPWPIPPVALLRFAGMIGISTIAGFSLYTLALGRVAAGVASIVAMSEIAFVAVYAYILLGERLGAVQIVGTALIVGGVVLLGSKLSAGRR